MNADAALPTTYELISRLTVPAPTKLQFPSESFHIDSACLAALQTMGGIFVEFSDAIDPLLARGNSRWPLQLIQENDKVYYFVPVLLSSIYTRFLFVRPFVLILQFHFNSRVLRPCKSYPHLIGKRCIFLAENLRPRRLKKYECSFEIKIIQLQIVSFFPRSRTIRLSCSEVSATPFLSANYTNERLLVPRYPECHSK